MVTPYRWVMNQFLQRLDTYSQKTKHGDGSKMGLIYRCDPKKLLDGQMFENMERDIVSEMSNDVEMYILDISRANLFEGERRQAYMLWTGSARGASIKN